MHPIERLRYVARSGWAGPSELGAEASFALAELSEREPAALLPACRRLLERNPACGPLWWVAARLLCSGDPWAEAERCAAALEDDPTATRLQDALGDRRAVHHGGVAEVASADVVLVRTDAAGPGGLVVDGDDLGLLQAARATDAEVWAVGGVGRVLPARLWSALVARLESEPSTSKVSSGAWFEPSRPAMTVVEPSGIAQVVGPDGICPARDGLVGRDCPEPAELTSRW